MVVRLKQALRRIATSGIASRGRAQVTARRVDAEVWDASMLPSQVCDALLRFRAPPLVLTFGFAKQFLVLYSLLCEPPL